MMGKAGQQTRQARGDGSDALREMPFGPFDSSWGLLVPVRDPAHDELSTCVRTFGAARLAATNHPHGKRLGASLSGSELGESSRNRDTVVSQERLGSLGARFSF